MDNTTKNNPKDFATNLLQKGKEAGMIWNGVIWVPADAGRTSSKSSKVSRTTRTSRVSRSTGIDESTGITKYAAKSFSKSFVKLFVSIGNEISTIKKTLFVLVKNQEKIRKKEEDERLRQRNEAYLAKFKKEPTKKEEPEKTPAARGGFLGFLTDLFKNLLGFFAIGIGLILLSKFLKQPGVQDAIKNLIVKIIETISGLIVKGAELVHDILKPGETSNKIIEFIEKILFSVVQVIADFVEFIKNFVQKVAADDALLGNIQSIIENIVITIFTVLKTAIESIKSAFNEYGPEITQGILKGITFILEGIASGIGFLTELLNNKEFTQGIADVIQSIYDLVASLYNVEVPIPGLGNVKLGTIVLVVTGTMYALELAMSGLLFAIKVWLVKHAIKLGTQAAAGVRYGSKGKVPTATSQSKDKKGGLPGLTECDGVLGGSGIPGSDKGASKGSKILSAIGTTLQVGGLAAGTAALAYSTYELSDRGDELEKKFSTTPTINPETGAETGTTGVTTPSRQASESSAPSLTTPSPSSSAVPSTAASTTSASAAVPPPMSTSTTSSSTTSPTPAGMPKTLLEYVDMEFERKKAREGFRNKAYASPEGGTDTIGIGHKKSKREQDEGGVFIGGQFIKADRNTPLTDQQVKDLYIQDIMKHAEGAKNRINSLAGQDVWSGLNPMQQYALMDLSYAGGPKLITKDLADAIKSGDMDKAAQIIQQKARTYRKNGATIESAHHAKHADLRANIFRGQDPMLSGGGATAVASTTPSQQSQPMSTPQSGGLNLASLNNDVNKDREDAFSMIEKMLPKELNQVGSSGGKTMNDLASKSSTMSPSMTGQDNNVAQLLNKDSQDLAKAMQDNDMLNMLIKQAKVGDGNQKIATLNNTNTQTSSERNYSVGSVYDEEFSKKIFG